MSSVDFLEVNLALRIKGAESRRIREHFLDRDVNAINGFGVPT